MKKHTEARLEDAIVDELTTQGGFEFVDYREGKAKDRYDKARALDSALVLGFIQSTQAKLWDSLKAIHKGDTEKVVLDHLVKELETKGMLKVLRQGFKCYGKKLRVAVFAPNNRLNPDTLALYGQNVLSVTRQLFYSDAHANSLDLVLFLNGLPLVTVELKNPMSGQTAADAIKQYKKDRDHRELLFDFKKRALVHFAVDQDEAWMTTRLSGDKTHFLPFNLGNKGCAGNPPAADGGYRTAYLWREVWRRDSVLEIFGRFMHLQQEEKRILTDEGIKKITKETMIFPRYHQLDSVRGLLRHARQHGPGHNYLVQHSAGSGKSNSIAWLAHQLASLHDAQDKRVFDSVIVVTDRRVLDQQLQNTIYQFEHKQGVVQKIEDDTRQLVQALATGTPIIITTLQKFPFVTETLEKLRTEIQFGLGIETKDKQFAVIVDEAHSSQSGESAMELKGVLNASGIKEDAAEYVTENEAESEDEADRMAGVVREMMKRAKQPNLSFFAFTATPKYKTKKVFDEPGPTGEAPFHLYTMRQAIEEKFILDVLKNYITYEAYFRLVQVGDEDPHVERKKASRALARTLTFHNVNLRTKTEVIVEHFRTHVRHKIGGRAKAMVVTDGRLHAVRYKLAIDSYIKEKGYTDIKTLVAFSGSVEDPKAKGKSWTEVGMNDGIKESELPSKFDSQEYQVLIVAEKYQTGFDQPLLHTMYVDKKLTGLQAVQTLSRLNRTCAGKEDTFVLDFRNTREEIFKAFKPYYENTPTEALTDPQHLYRLYHQIEETGIIFTEEVKAFCSVYFKPERKVSVRDHAQLNGILDQAVERFKEREKEEREEVKAFLVNFRNLYGFLSQVIPYQDTDLEELYTYLRFLLTKLPRRDDGGPLQLEDDVELQYYRLQKISEGRIDLNTGDAHPLKGPSDVGTGQNDEKIKLSELIDILNERFGTDFTQADQFFFDQIQEEAVENEALRKAAAVNSKEDFRHVFEKAFEGLVIDRMEGNEEIFGKLMADGDFRKLAIEHLLEKVYRDLSRSETSEKPSKERKPTPKDMMPEPQPMSKPKPHVFVSHSTHDKPFVRKLIADLKGTGIKVWFDEEDITTGSSIVTKINDALAEVNYLLLIHSKYSAESSWVREELAAALYTFINGGDLTVVTAVLDNTELIPFLKHRLWIDFRKAAYDSAKEKLINFFKSDESKVGGMPPSKVEGDGGGNDDCPARLALLEKRQLRKRVLGTQVPRDRLAIIWMDVLNTRLDDELPGKAIEFCVQELIARAEGARRMSVLLEIFCEDLAGIN